MLHGVTKPGTSTPRRSHHRGRHSPAGLKGVPRGSARPISRLPLPCKPPGPTQLQQPPCHPSPPKEEPAPNAPSHFTIPICKLMFLRGCNPPCAKTHAFSPGNLPHRSGRVPGSPGADIPPSQGGRAGRAPQCPTAVEGDGDGVSLQPSHCFWLRRGKQLPAGPQGHLPKAREGNVAPGTVEKPAQGLQCGQLSLRVLALPPSHSVAWPHPPPRREGAGAGKVPATR